MQNSSLIIYLLFFKGRRRNPRSCRHPNNYQGFDEAPVRRRVSHRGSYHSVPTLRVQGGQAAGRSQRSQHNSRSVQ